MPTRFAWLIAGAVVAVAPGSRAPQAAPPTLDGAGQAGRGPLQVVIVPPELLEVPTDCRAVGFDFVPPLSDAQHHAPAVSPLPPPGADTPRRWPVENARAGLAEPATGPAAEENRSTPSAGRLPPIASRTPPIDPASAWLPAGAPPSALPAANMPAAPPSSPSATPAAPAQTPARSPMQAVNARARAITRNAEHLAERGAFYSARSEFIQALRVITQALDALSPEGTAHSQALAEGLRALAEADHFSPTGSQLEANLDLPGIIAGHRTPVLKQADPERLTALGALQQYYTFAHHRLAAAGGHEPAAAEALFGLGRLTMMMADRSPDERRFHTPKAMALYQAALAVDGGQARAAHELGVLYAQFGQLEDARRLLVHSAGLAPRVETWHNLAIVHDRLGEADLARRARYERELAARQSPGTTSSGSGVTVDWVEASRFAQQPSPASSASIPSASTPSPANTPRAATRPPASGWSNPWLR